MVGAEKSTYMKKAVRKKILSLVPRIEMLVFFVGLLCVVYGKCEFFATQKVSSLWSSFAFTLISDLLFFFWILFFVRLLYMLRFSVFIVRFTLLVSILYASWSLLNTVWLMRSGVQLQPGVIRLMIRDYKELWPFIQPFVIRNFHLNILLGVGGLVIFVFFMYFLIYPQKVVPVRRHHGLRAALFFLCILLLLTQQRLPAQSNSNYCYSVLGFSSHYCALTSFLPSIKQSPQTQEDKSRQLLRAGQRQIVSPETPSGDLPNIILVLLESVSFKSTSFHDPDLNTTPVLARLAEEGVHFKNTRVPVTHTTKAYWATLTGSYPVINSDYVEAIPSEYTYEGLPSLLRGLGYCSAFFEMSRGSFECAPGFFNNLGFDWAWFRENLEDSSKYVGLVAGDDCVMLDPAFEWASQSSGPFLLMMITSIAHEPYDVPDWFGSNDKGAYDKYIQTVQYTDHFIDRLCARMKDHGFDENTILCIIGDHGTSFRTFRMNQARWNPYEELIRVPWILHWPGHLKAGTVIESPCSQLDITPTLLNLIGFDISNAYFEGQDALSFSEPDRKLYFSSWLPNSPLGYVQSNKKVVYWPYIDKIFEYDLAEDPDEESPQVFPSSQKWQKRDDILNWQNRTMVEVDPKQYTERLLYSHWQVFSTGDFAGAYYISR